MIGTAFVVEYKSEDGRRIPVKIQIRAEDGTLHGLDNCFELVERTTRNGIEGVEGHFYGHISWIQVA